MTDARTPTIAITGAMKKCRQKIDIDGLAVYITRTSFRYLLRLIWAHWMKPDGWIARKDFGVGEAQTQNLARLRHEVYLGYMEAGKPWPEWMIYESDAFKRVRFVGDPKQITIGPEVGTIPDEEIRKMVRDIKRMERRTS